MWNPFDSFSLDLLFVDETSCWVTLDAEVVENGLEVFSLQIELVVAVVDAAEDLEVLEDVQDIVLFDVCFIRNGLYVDFGEFLVFKQETNDLHRPPADVAPEAQVRERSLRRSFLLLNLAQFVGELDQELAVPLSLALRQYQDAREVVLDLRSVLLREVASKVVLELWLTHLVFDPDTLNEHIEEEWTAVKSDVLVIKEQFGDETQVLTVEALCLA